MAILRVADTLSRASFSPYKQFGSLIRVNFVKARQSEHTERCWIRQRDKLSYKRLLELNRLGWLSFYPG